MDFLMIILMYVILFWDLLVSNFTSTCSTILHVPGKNTTNIPTLVDDTSTLVS